MNGESNGDWGTLSQYDDELAEVWDGYSTLPEAGKNVALDSFVERKRITINSLVRLGARLSSETVLAFAFPGGIKYRDIVTDARWNYTGSEFAGLKYIKHSATQGSRIIVVESETDAARVSDLYDSDVAILPAGARRFVTDWADDLDKYDQVLIGLDNDRAGDEGAAKIITALPKAQRFLPGDVKDWCSLETDPPEYPEIPRPIELLVPLGQMMELPEPEFASWFEQALLPIGGSLILHGWVKSYKSFLSLDMMAALAQGHAWAGFEPIEEPCKVCVMQYELPWAYYRQRADTMLEFAHEPALLRENLLTYTPLIRPQFRAGNVKQEDALLRVLLEAHVQVFLLDPVRRAAGGLDLNAENEVRVILNFIERVNNEGISVIACHHDNKSAARRGGGEAIGMTGSGAWSGDVDSIVSIELPNGDNHRTSIRRNLNFLLRHAPTPSARGFEMQEDGRILYSPTPYGDEDGEDQPDEPSI